MIAAQVLACPMDPAVNDAGATSIGDYLHRLLADVWAKEDEFNGKRPFGNSGWKYEVYAALAHAGLIEGTFDEYGYLDTVDSDAADELVRSAIAGLSSSGGEHDG